MAHELAGGHLIARHVGLTDAQLIGRLAQQPRITAASTFSNLGAAESQVSAALAANRSQISQFLAGNSQRMVINHSSSRVVGRGSTTATPATNIRVVIQRDPKMSSGYRIVTGFPVPWKKKRTRLNNSSGRTFIKIGILMATIGNKLSQHT